MNLCPLYDTHAHLAYPQLSSQLETVLAHAREHEVVQLNCVATDLETTQAAIDMARRFPHIHATAGWHPNDCLALTPALWDDVCKLAQLPEVVALGETGLDLYWKDCPLEIQQHWFSKHWELSRQLGKPVIIHLRDCETEMLAALEQEYDRGGPLHGVMHSFSGSSQTAARCVELGLHISFAGMLTYKNAENLRSTAREIPGERLLVETDAPFLAPMPHRGQKPNLPGWVRHTAQCLADCRNTSLEALARLTTENACRLFAVTWSQNSATD